ncbi:MAG: acyl-CoA reductase [Telmatospirillum sp.]|nr:acyl-CoA reductase [Telmatospirillum sp.]
MDMSVDILLPDAGPADADALDRRLARIGTPLGREPFAGDALLFCERLSAAILSDPVARRIPDLEAFAFWIRRKAIERLATRFADGAPPGTIRLPRGVILHLPPGNAAMMFAYGWILALLCGNHNIVRLSRRRPPEVGLLLRLIGAELSRLPDLARGQLFLSYGHDDQITARLSAVCDLRAIWGGDDTVNRIRSIALPAQATELTFADRFSMAAFQANAVLDLHDENCAALADRFFNDVFLFDQMACASPRIVVWVGEPSDCRAAAGRFYQDLAAVAGRKGGDFDAGTLCAKLSYAFRSILDWPVSGMRRYGGRLLVLTLTRFHDFRSDVMGGGTLFEIDLPGLDSLLPHVRRKDQTLVHFGFSDQELRRFVGQLGGRGFDRLVPAGQALFFDPVWDGQDLLAAFSRPVSVLCSA